MPAYFITITLKDSDGNVATTGVKVSDLLELINGDRTCNSDHDGSGKCGNPAIAFDLPAVVPNFPFPVGSFEVRTFTEDEHNSAKNTARLMQDMSASISDIDPTLN